MNQVSYALGMSIGHQLQQMNATELNLQKASKMYLQEKQR